MMVSDMVGGTKDTGGTCRPWVSQHALILDYIPRAGVQLVLLDTLRVEGV